MEQDAGFERYLYNIYHKICIAVAICVSRSKPEELSLEEHVKNVRASCLKNWQNENEVSSFEKRIVTVEQNKILKEINNLLPISASQNDSEFGSDEWFPCIIEDAHLPALEEHDSTSDNESAVENNAEFMRALIKLKFAVNTRRTFILKRPTNSLMSRSSADSSKKSQAFNKTSYFNQNDSGFDSLEGNSYRSKTFSTCLLRFVTNSSETDILITKHLKTIFNYIEKSFKKNTMIYFTYWKDSILENIFRILKELSTDTLCSEGITIFVEDMLEEIWNCIDIDKNLDWEYQCTLLSDLCCTQTICTNILYFLINKIGLIIETISQMKTTLTETSDQSFIEKISHFIEMTSVLLIKWKRFNKKCNNENFTKDTFNDVIKYWQKQSNNEKSEDESEVSVIRSWKQTFEKLFNCLTENFPLISLPALDLITNVEKCLINHEEEMNLDFDNNMEDSTK